MVNKSNYKSITAELSPHQTSKIVKAIKAKTAISINLTSEQLESKKPTFRFFLSTVQYLRYQTYLKGEMSAHSLRINFSPSQLSHAVQLKDDLEIHPLSNVDIDEIMRNRKWYKGTYMSDELLNIQYPKGDFGIVMNLDESTNSGTHWVGIASKDGGIPLYFDSYGFPPPNDIFEWMTKQLKEAKIRFSPVQVQKQKSVKCGYFVIEWLETVFESSPQKAMNKFDKEPSDKNERVALEK